MIKKPHEISVTNSRTMLEATRLNKEFLFDELSVEKKWKKKHMFGRENFYYTKSKKYEFKWRNVGDTNWGRTELVKEDGEPMVYSVAIKTFFEALDASESMSFREL